MEENETVGVRPLRDALYGNMRQPLLILLASVGFVLLIACVNVANLQLAQAAGRHHEIALRTALGASTSTLVRQLLVESFCSHVIGGAAGCRAAFGRCRALLALSPVDVPYAERIAVDWRVLAFALGLADRQSCVRPAAGLAVGAAEPRRRASCRGATGRRPDEPQGAASARRGRGGARTMLTVGAALLVKSLVGLQSTPPGFAVEQVLTMKLALPEARYGSGDALARFQEQIEERLALVPGVRAAALAHTLPLQFVDRLPFTIEGRYVPGTETGVGDANFRPIGRGYFEALEIPFRGGRVFDARDRRGTLLVAIINEAAARRFWPGQIRLDSASRLVSRSCPTSPIRHLAKSSASSGMSGTGARRESCRRLFTSQSPN